MARRRTTGLGAGLGSAKLGNENAGVLGAGGFGAAGLGGAAAALGSAGFEQPNHSSRASSREANLWQFALAGDPAPLAQPQPAATSP